jgi:uncharacterized DUF497 family protein
MTEAKPTKPLVRSTLCVKLTLTLPIMTTKGCGGVNNLRCDVRSDIRRKNKRMSRVLASTLIGDTTTMSVCHYGALERRLRTISQRDVKRRNTTTANKPRKHDKEVQGTPQTQ